MQVDELEGCLLLCSKLCIACRITHANNIVAVPALVAPTAECEAAVVADR